MFHRRLPEATEIDGKTGSGIEVNFFVEIFDGKTGGQIRSPPPAKRQHDGEVLRIERANRLGRRLGSNLYAGNGLRDEADPQRAAKTRKSYCSKFMIDALQPTQMGEGDMRAAHCRQPGRIPVERRRLIDQRRVSFAKRGAAAADADFQKGEAGFAGVL